MIDKKEYDILVQEIMECTKCELHKTRRNPVPGEGSLDPKIMFIGEAPGGREDETGRPFVGAAGKLLTMLIESIGLSREDVYITNVVKCRPPGNRDPSQMEIYTCLPYLRRQINIIRPRLIVTLGRHAARVIMDLAGLKFTSITKQHGTVNVATISGIKVIIIPTYHPAAALYNPSLKQMLIDDFETIKKYIEARPSDIKRGPLDDFIK